MNYISIYENIIERAKTREIVGYKERHHIIPRSLGGTDNNDNLVDLTAREHFLCHYLLTKIYEKETFNHYKMLNAFIMMKSSSLTHANKRYFNSLLYESLRIEFSKLQSFNQIGEKNSQYGTIWMHNLTLKESKKVPKSDIDKWIIIGWIKGRKIKFSSKTIVCKNCKTEFTQQTKERFCSDICRKSKQNLNALGISNDEKEMLFIKYYNETKSVNKSLKMMGYPGNVGDHCKWAKKTLDKHKSL